MTCTARHGRLLLKTVSFGQDSLNGGTVEGPTEGRMEEVGNVRKMERRETYQPLLCVPFFES